MVCSSNLPSCSLREPDPRAARYSPRFATLALVTLLGACTGTVTGSNPGAGSGGAGNGQPAGSGGTGMGQPPGSGGSQGGGQPGTASGGSGGSQPGTASGGTSGTGTGGAGVVSKGGTMLRLLTAAEYTTSVQQLLGTISAQMPTTTDTSVAGFVSVGASQMSVTDTAATAYEAASLAATGEVFADMARWQKLVGCAPKADLSDACVTTYIKTFGKSAWRRDLTNEEVTQWLGVAKNAATLAGTAAQGLSTLTAGLLQSPNFLYRVETNKLDTTNNRLKYDGLSMATRLSYLLTGGPPTPALLTAATSGQLDTVDGVKTASAPLLSGSVLTDRMAAFFNEYVQAQQVMVIAKSTTLFPTFTTALKTSMLTGTQMFIKNVVLGANADVRSFYDSDVTYADASLATLYGVTAPASGFGQVKLPATSGRAGILGQAAVIAGQSQSDRTSPTRRGIFILEALLCTPAPQPPGGVDLTVVPPDASHTTRQNLEAHRVDMKCAGCHQLFDPMGLALEHFDPIGRYREKENGLTIDATGSLNNVPFDGGAQLGAVLKQDPRATACMLRNFYRNANGRAEDGNDLAQIDVLAKALAARNYVWSGLVADFVASDAFRSAPALPVN
jgi:hypothetical protein